MAAAAVFVLFTLATALRSGEEVAHAASGGGAHGWLVAGFWVLKTAVVGAFAFFVARRPSSARAARAPGALVACTLAILAVVLVRTPDDGAATARLVAGEVLATGATAFILASVLVLGTCFGVLPEARGLVTRGPYRLVRHPVYLGELGACAGLVLSAPSLWNAACLLVLVLAQVWRTGYEEAALAAEFGAYRAYAARTPRLIPGRRPRPTYPTPGVARLHRPPQEA
jgi:protein-S-isoprenylcysteine O-methyltransferase Ste14